MAPVFAADLGMPSTPLAASTALSEFGLMFCRDIRRFRRGLAGQSTVVFSAYSRSTIGGRLRGGLRWSSHRYCFPAVGCCDALGPSRVKIDNLLSIFGFAVRPQS